MRKAGVVVLCLGVALAFYFFFAKTSTAPPPASPEKVAQPSTAAQDAAVATALARQSPATAAIIQSNFARVQPAPGNTVSSPPSAVGTSSPAPSGQPLALQFTNFPPAIVLENMRRTVRQYGEMFGGNPIGTNPEITDALAGDNARHINFLDADNGMRTNSNGELIDPWGTPYFFHQLSGHDMEIHSAGPDGILWTSDDLVVK